MHSKIRQACAAGAAIAVLWPLAATPEVTGVDVDARSVLASGQRYGLAGSYEKLAGRLHFALDPKLEANRIVRDLEHVPVGEDRRVAFSADFFLMKPTNPARGNGTVLLEVANRGRKGMLQMLSFATASADPQTPGELGDGFLLEQGFTLLWVGWQFDVPDDAGLLRVHAPMTGSDGAPIVGRVRSDFVARSRVESHSLADRGHRAYPARALDDPEDVLTVRDEPDGERRKLPRSAWRFARVESGREIADPTHVTLDGGFEANRIYEVVYTSENPPVAGTGLAAIRDAVATIRHDGADALGLPQGSIRHALAFGISQSGRLLRELVYDGFNTDERGRIVFDGLMPHIAGGARGSFNHRFAQPSRASWSYHYPNAVFPFTDAVQDDSVTGESDGLLAGIPARNVPKIVYTNSSNEYWRGTAALTHVSADGERDVAPPDNVRIYLLAGTQHVPASFPSSRTQGRQPNNPNSYAWFLRALVLALDDWVKGGAAPPPSRVPTLAGGSLVARTAFAFPAIPGVPVPAEVAAARRIDFGPQFTTAGIVAEPPVPGAAYPALVPQVNADGNETSGLLSAALAVPLATFTGWNLYDPAYGPEHELVALQGSRIPFAASAAQRAASGDPRPAIDERYPSREHYLGLVTEHALELVESGFVRAADVAPIVREAARRFDHVAGSSR